MRFLIQNTRTGTQHDRAVATTIQQHFPHLDLASPMHLIQTLEDYFLNNRLPFSAHHTAGTVNVNSHSGIILRFRSIN